MPPCHNISSDMVTTSSSTQLENNNRYRAVFNTVDAGHTTQNHVLVSWCEGVLRVSGALRNSEVSSSATTPVMHKSEHSALRLVVSRSGPQH